MHSLIFAQEAASQGEGLITEYMWLVPLLPALACLVIGFVGRRLPDKGHGAGIGALVLA